MVNRDDPSVFQIDKGLDLIGGHKESYNLTENQFSVGVSAYTIEMDYTKGSYARRNFDLSSLFYTYSYEIEYFTSNFLIKNFEETDCVITDD